MRRLGAFLFLTMFVFATPAQAGIVNDAAKMVAEGVGEVGGSKLMRDLRALETPEGGAGGELASIRACESGGDYSINTGNGFLGAYQFMQSTWDSAAPAAGYGEYAGVPVNEVPPGVQDAVAQSHIDNGHRGAWPNC